MDWLSQSRRECKAAGTHCTYTLDLQRGFGLLPRRSRRWLKPSFPRPPRGSSSATSAPRLRHPTGKAREHPAPLSGQRYTPNCRRPLGHDAHQLKAASLEVRAPGGSQGPWVKWPACAPADCTGSAQAWHAPEQTSACGSQRPGTGSRRVTPAVPDGAARKGTCGMEIR
jgi:hypothetical protein